MRQYKYNDDEIRAILTMLRREKLVAACCEHENETEVDVTGGEILRRLNIILLHRKVFVPRSCKQIVG
jgi:hypothetical protein